jgi:ubiquitin C-terminal hydrolase
MFRGTRQHDSEEFIISLIEILNDDIILNTVKLQNKILIDNMLKKMSIKSGVSPAIIRNCAKQKK